MKLRKNKKGKEVQEEQTLDKHTMNRKEAIRKTGYIALSAATMMLLLSKPETAAASPAPPPDSDWP